MSEGPLTRAPPKLRDVQQAAREDDLCRTLDLRDLSEEAAICREDLDAVALAIAHEHVPRRIDRDPVRQHELTGSGPWLAPRSEQLSRRREAMHSSVPVAVRDEEVAVRRDREVRWAVEGGRAARDRREVGPVVPAVRGLSRVVAKRQQQRSVG